MSDNHIMTLICYAVILLHSLRHEGAYTGSTHTHTHTRARALVFSNDDSNTDVIMQTHPAKASQALQINLAHESDLAISIAARQRKILQGHNPLRPCAYDEITELSTVNLQSRLGLPFVDLQRNFQSLQ